MRVLIELKGRWGFVPYIGQSQIRSTFILGNIKQIQDPKGSPLCFRHVQRCVILATLQRIPDAMPAGYEKAGCNNNARAFE
jgi:hypothetical protein